MEEPKTLKDLSPEQLQVMGFQLREQIDALNERGQMLVNQLQAIRQEIQGRATAPTVEALVETEKKD